MMVINLRLIAAIPFYLIAAMLALGAVIYQFVGLFALIMLNIRGIILSEVISIVLGSVAAGVMLIAQAIRGGAVGQADTA